MKILLVEDEDAVADYVGMFLREAGYQIELARTGALARSVVATNLYDLILLDLVLSDTTGEQLLPDLRKLAPKTPIMIMSGLAFDDERLLFCLKNGANGYVPKSSRAEDLLVSVRRALRD